MLCRSFRHDGTELLDQGRGLQAYMEQGKTMGVPLLYPWANRLAGLGYSAAGKQVTLREDDPRLPRDKATGLPIHGVLPGLLHWKLDPAAATDNVSATLAWTSPELRELFPFTHEVRVSVAIDAGRLAIATTVIATGEDVVPISFGYHPYLRVPDGPRETWRVDLAATERLLLDEQMIPTGKSEALQTRSFVLEDRELDDGYTRLDEPPRFAAAGQNATVAVEFRRGYRYAQVYAPPGKEFICFEPMTAPTNALRSGDGLSLLAPGDEYRAEFTVTVRLP